MDKIRENNFMQNVFPKVCDVIESSNYIEQCERWQYQYPVILRYLKNKINGWNICDFFQTYGYRRVALYAVTDFTELILQDIEANNRIEHHDISVYDTNYQKFVHSYMGYEVNGIHKLIEKEQLGKLDCIIVCSLMHENEIISSLMQKGVKQEKIISIVSVIFSM